MANPIVVLDTSSGTIEIELYPDKAPKTVENFTTHLKNGYYENVIFHRIIKDFMIQGGDPTGSGMGGQSIWGSTFEDECHQDLSFEEPGLLAMANAGPGTNGSQFFITTVATPWLHMKHTIFGKVVGGMDVVSKMEGIPTDRGDRPKIPQKILKGYVKEAAEE